MQIKFAHTPSPKTLTKKMMLICIVGRVFFEEWVPVFNCLSGQALAFTTDKSPLSAFSSRSKSHHAECEASHVAFLGSKGTY